MYPTKSNQASDPRQPRRGMERPGYNLVTIYEVQATTDQTSTEDSTAVLLHVGC